MQGTYSSLIAISFTLNSSIPAITIFVSLTVSPPTAALVPTPTSLSFRYQTGGSPPPSQAINVSNPAVGSLTYSVAISDSWLAVSPSTGITPGTLTVSVSPQNLAPGSYTGTITLTAQGVATTTVSVTVFVSASTTPQPFIISNSASGVGNQLAPGEIISIKGSGLGPGTPVSFSVSTLNQPTLAGVQVTFNGYSGTLLYVSSTQINVTVPYEVASNPSVSIVVIYQGVPSAAIRSTGGRDALGLFTTDNATGSSARRRRVNSNYAYNTSASPALQGSYISRHSLRDRRRADQSGQFRRRSQPHDQPVTSFGSTVCDSDHRRQAGPGSVRRGGAGLRYRSRSVQHLGADRGIHRERAADRRDHQRDPQPAGGHGRGAIDLSVLSSARPDRPAMPWAWASEGVAAIESSSKARCAWSSHRR